MQFGGFALRGVDEDESAALFCCALTPLTAWLPDDAEEREELELGEAELVGATRWDLLDDSSILF